MKTFNVAVFSLKTLPYVFQNNAHIFCIKEDINCVSFKEETISISIISNIQELYSLPASCYQGHATYTQAEVE